MKGGGGAKIPGSPRHMTQAAFFATHFDAGNAHTIAALPAVAPRPKSGNWERTTSVPGAVAAADTDKGTQNISTHN